MTELQNIVAALVANSTAPAVLATLVSVAGSSYRRPGARLLLTSDGRRIGSISGGCLEADVLARARQVLSTGTPDLVTYDTSSENDLVWGVGLGCHGVVQVLIEKLSPSPAWLPPLASNLNSGLPTALAVIWRTPQPAHLGTHLASSLPPLAATSSVFHHVIEPPLPLVIFGAGDDAQPLARLARELGWRVTVADPRRDFATAERFPDVDTLVVAPSPQLVSKTALPPGALAVVMTHHYVHDVPILRDLLTRDLRYIGLLGPRKRAERILDDLSRDGLTLTASQRARLHAPVGLDLGAETPEEVALSIVAEIQAVLAHRNAQPLRERNQPIHG